MRIKYISSPLFLILSILFICWVLIFLIDGGKQEQANLTENEINELLRMIKLSALDEESVGAVIQELKKMINDAEINERLDSIDLKKLTNNIRTTSDPKIKALLERFL